MAIVNAFEAALSIDARGALGPYRRWKAGEITWAQAQAEMPYAGIYIQRRTAEGIKLSRTKYYKPSNPRTVAQQSWRNLLKAGAVLWSLLTPEGKATYNERAKRLRMTGYNLFIREWLAAF